MEDSKLVTGKARVVSNGWDRKKQEKKKDLVYLF